MRKKIRFLLLGCLLFTGCGDIKWFPEDTSASQPVLTKAYSTTSTVIGNPVTLTYTITNADGNPAQTGLGFTDTLPGSTQNSTVGMFVANPPNVSSTCGGTVSTGGTTNPVTGGDPALTFSGGSIGAGPSSCTVSIQVTSNASTTNFNASFVSGFANITDVTSNLVNNVTNQFLAFSPFTQITTTGTLSARDLVVTPNGTPQFTLFLDNTGFAANVTVSVEGKNATDTLPVITIPVPATPVFAPNGVSGQQLILNGVTVDPTIKTWRISGINVT
jgi:hypothetical protein